MGPLAAFDAAVGAHQLTGMGLGGEEGKFAAKDGGGAEAGEPVSNSSESKLFDQLNRVPFNLRKGEPFPAQILQ